MSRLYFKYEKRFCAFRNIVLLVTFIILVKFSFIQILSSSSYKNLISEKTKTYKYNKGHRGNIYDRNNNLLAYST